MLTLAESLERQTDHFLRCQKLAAQHGPNACNSAENENRSYSELVAALPSTGRVLDLGCGGGGAYPYLKGYDYYGIECVSAAAKIAIDAGLPNISVGFMEQMPYDAGFFDIVWARHVLEHSSDINLVLREVQRVLKPDGTLGFIVPCGFHNEPAHISEFTKEGWIETFESNGWTIVKSWQHDFNLNEFCGIARRAS